MIFTDSGSSQEQKFGILLNILSPSTVHVGGIQIDVNELHNPKIQFPIFETDVGIDIDFNELHSQNVSLFNSEIHVGSVIDVNDMQ